MFLEWVIRVFAFMETSSESFSPPSSANYVHVYRFKPVFSHGNTPKMYDAPGAQGQSFLIVLAFSIMSVLVVPCSVCPTRCGQESIYVEQVTGVFYIIDSECI